MSSWRRLHDPAFQLSKVSAVVLVQTFARLTATMTCLWEQCSAGDIRRHCPDEVHRKFTARSGRLTSARVDVHETVSLEVARSKCNLQYSAHGNT